MQSKKNQKLNHRRKPLEGKDFSLVVKLNSRFLWRLFSIFILLDIFFLATFIFFFVYKAEQDFTDIYEDNRLLFTASESSSGGAEGLSDLTLYGDYQVFDKVLNNGFKLPQFFYSHSQNTFSSLPRYVDINTASKSEIMDRIGGTTYYVSGKSFTLQYNIGEDLRRLSIIFSLILVLEGILLLGSIPAGARVIRRSLKPIYEIEKATRTLRNTTSLAELTAITGRINKIEAENLNSRIAVDSAQEELKGLAAAINDLLERIEESYRSQARFVSDASHELRTPISVIQGYANLLDRWGKNDEKTLQESINAIKNEADGMKDLIEQLLFLARGDNEAMHIENKAFNLTLLAEEVCQESQMIDPNHEIVFRSQGSFTMQGDIQLMKQALRIFLDNSIKYTPVREKITVTASGDEKWAKVRVQDNGIGIVPADLPYIFDRFYRSDDSRTRKTGGTGLGLSIAQWIIHRHGGHLDVLSRKDFGTRITIFIPLCKEETPSS